MDFIERDIAIGAGVEAYRAYQATGDTRVAAKAGISGGATVAAGGLTGTIAFFCGLNALGAFLAGEPGIGVLSILAAAFLTWATVALCMAHGHRMRRYMAPQAVPAPPGSLPPLPGWAPHGPSRPWVPPTTSTAVATQPSTQNASQQYTYDLRTGQYHKNW